MNVTNKIEILNDHRLKANRGFTLMELMVAVAIVGILATMAMPSFYISRQRSEVAEVLRKADTIREDISDYYNINLSFPSDNHEAGVPEPDLLIGNKFSRIEIEDGAIHITLGNKISTPLRGKILSLRPAIVSGSPKSPIAWLCGADSPVSGMEAIGENKTDLDDAIVPRSCDK